MGVFMLAWLVSGILMMTPERWFMAGPSREPGHIVDYSKIFLSPADIISRLDADRRAPQAITSMKLRQIRDRIIYKVRFSDGEVRLFDARTGQLFVFTSELAEVLARDAYPSKAAVLSIEKLEEHDLLYSWGALPAYRLRFEDYPSAIITVVQADGRVMRLTFMMGIRRAITGLHGFEPVKLVTDNENVRKGLLILTGMIALFGSLVGLYLALPARRKE